MRTRKSIRKGVYRIIQYGLKIGMSLLPWRQPKLMQGGGAVKRLPMWIRRKGFKKVLIVTDENLMRLHLLDDMLRESGVEEFQVTELEMIPQSEVELSGEDLETFEKLYSVLEDDEDVQKIYTNVDGF